MKKLTKEVQKMYVGVWIGPAYDGQVTYLTEPKGTPQEALSTEIAVHSDEKVRPMYAQEIFIKQ